MIYQDSSHLPRHIISKQRAGEFHRQSLLVILRFVFTHTEEYCSRVRSDALVPRMQQFGQDGCGALSLNRVRAIFVLCELTQDAGGHTDNVFDFGVQKL